MKKIKMMNYKMAINPEKENEATLDIFDDIGEYTDVWDDKTVGFGPKKIIEFLEENKKVDTIHVRINSCGGDVFDGIAVHNLLKSSGKKINVEVVGIAASIASVIAMAGEVSMYPTSQMMIHNCWTLGVGNANDFRKLADDMDKIMESSKKAYLEKVGTRLTEEKIQELLDNETYLTAQECLDLGLCDEIIGKEEQGEEKKESHPKPQQLMVDHFDQPSIEPIQHEMNWFF